MGYFWREVMFCLIHVMFRFLLDFFLVWIVTLIIQLKAKNKTMWPPEFLSLLNNQAACMYTKALQSCSTLCNPIDSTAPGSSWPWDSLGENIGVGWHACLQGIFLTQGSNLRLPHCRRILYHLSHQGSPDNKANIAFCSLCERQQNRLHSLQIKMT